MTIQPAIPMPSDASQPAEAAARVTPMMEQYLEIKAAHPGLLLFYRMGDFYELFFEDAEIASRTLGIVLTKRGKHQGLDIPMCGVPVERAEDYLHRLIEAGHRVAVCEQTEDPAAARARGNKSVVRRAVVRLVTPGTLTEDTLLDARANNYLLAIARARGSAGGDRIGLAWIDISTSEFIVTECATGRTRSDPGAHQSQRSDRYRCALWRSRPRPAAARIAGGDAATRDVFDGATAERRLCDYFAVATMDGLGAMSRLEATAAAAAVTYIDRTQVGKRPPLSPPSREAAGTTMAIDPATRANLELTRTLSGERRGSLLDAIDCTVTAAGSRLLGAAARRAAHRLRRDRAAARCDRGLCCRLAPARRCPDHAARSARSCRARWRACRSDAAARAISPACATASWPPMRRWRGLRSSKTPPPEIAAIMAALRRPARDAGPRIDTRARRATAADQARRRLCSRGL